jgi:uncharacterized protein
VNIPVVSSAITFAETAAALGAARRARRLSMNTLTSALASLDTRWRLVTSVDVDERLTRAASSLAIRHELRGMDAIHLASALLFAAASPIVVTWDADLRRAAASEGLAVSV